MADFCIAIDHDHDHSIELIFVVGRTASFIPCEPTKVKEMSKHRKIWELEFLLQLKIEEKKLHFCES